MKNKNESTKKNEEESIEELFERLKISKGELNELKLDDIQTLSDKDFEKLRDSGVSLKEDKEKEKEMIKTAYYNIIDILKKYVDLKEEYYNIIALWIIGTYFHDKFISYPYLYFNAMKGSGKSRTMNLITTLAKDGEMLNSLTEAVLFRTRGTLAIDEFEGIGRKGNESLRELLNSAYKKGTKVKRMKMRKSDKGTEQVVEEFEVYRPIVIANIWGMDNVLSDRCITLVLERSSNKKITNLIEIFYEEEVVKKTKKILNQCSLCSYVHLEKAYKEWNNFVINNYTNYTNYIHNINYTNYTELFKALKSMTSEGINGRDLELSFPLTLIASGISEAILKETTLTLKNIFHKKNEEELVENYDISLYDFISKYYISSWVSINKLSSDFRDFMQSNEEWLNSKWMGRALKRLDLVKDKKRHASGVSVILNIEKAEKKIGMFK